MSLVLAGLGGDELVTLGLAEFVPYAPSEDSYKDLFEADVFRPGLFASGVWRGQGGTMTTAFCVRKLDSFAPGAMKSSSFLPGTKAFDEHTPGPTKAGGC